MRSAHQFSRAVFLCLLVSLPAIAAVKDRYIFRIADGVVGINDMMVAQEDLLALQCRFPDTLLENWTNSAFIAKFKKVTAKLNSASQPLREDQGSIIFLTSVRQMWKMLAYVDGQDVTIGKDLEKSVANVPGCPRVVLAQGKMRDSFYRWLRVEIYLRSRYAPTGIVKTKEWREKRLISISQFVESIDKQVTHENFW